MKNKIDFGQVFTPKSIAKYMTDLLTVDIDSAILEPCFGEGVFLDILKEKYTNIDGVELDINLFNNLKKSHNYTLYNENFLSFNPRKKYNGIIMNPPYIRHEKINDLENYGVSKSLITKNSLFKSMSLRANLYMYFIIKAISLLEEQGELIVIFPNTWKKSKVGESFSKLLMDKATITDEIFINGNVFGSNALVDVLILKIIKTKIKVKPNIIHLKFVEETLINVPIKNSTLDESKHKLLSQYSKIRRGLTTGYNALFISNTFKEKPFLKYTEKIICSPKDIINYSTDNCKFQYLLNLQNSIDSYENEIQEYIENFKRIIIENKRPKTIHSKIISDKKWYKIKPFKNKGIIFSYIIRDNMKFILDESDFIIRDNFYIIEPSMDTHLLFALLNNYYTYYRIEKMGKLHGAGILKLQKYDMDRLPIVDIDLISIKDKKTLIKLSFCLRDSGCNSYIEKITKILEKYESYSLKEVKSKLLIKKTKRLNKN